MALSRPKAECRTKFRQKQKPARERTPVGITGLPGGIAPLPGEHTEVWHVVAAFVVVGDDLSLDVDDQGSDNVRLASGMVAKLPILATGRASFLGVECSRLLPG